MLRDIIQNQLKAILFIEKCDKVVLDRLEAAINADLEKAMMDLVGKRITRQYYYKVCEQIRNAGSAPEAGKTAAAKPSATT